MTGPFDLREVLNIRLPSHDGVELEGWVGLPDLPKGVKAPVALTSTPYIGDARGDTPDQAQFWSDNPKAGEIRNWGVIPIELIRNGYAAAFFSVRGTGNSGGCFNWLGNDEQLDQTVIIDWLAKQPWSNGRVGMGGLSYRAAPPVEAAVQNPEPLKTIVISGTIVDRYTAIFTPQGAVRFFDAVAADTLIPVEQSVAPPVAGGAEHATAEHIPVVPERICPEVLDVMAAGERQFLMNDRKEAFWRERSFLEGLPGMTASILLAQGFKDVLNHGFQDSPIWRLAPNAPKRQITGQWAHAFPWPEVAQFDPSWEENDWSETLFAWLDYWLKGQGAPPRLGVADYQDGDGTWHESNAWPPGKADDEVLYLAGGELAQAPTPGDEVSRPAPTVLNARRSLEWNGFPVQPWWAMCPDPLSESTDTAGIVYVSEPLTEDSLIAGEAFAFLEVSSDQPGGTVRVQIAEIVGGTTECDAAGQPSNVRVLTAGAADLRFHAGGFTGVDFPVDDPTHVRVDLWDMAETIHAGSRLVVVVMGAEPSDEWTGQPYQPELTIHAGSASASQIVLPVVSGSTGGAKPMISYPPRPFIPQLVK